MVCTHAAVLYKIRLKPGRRHKCPCLRSATLHPVPLQVGGTLNGGRCGGAGWVFSVNKFPPMLLAAKRNWEDTRRFLRFVAARFSHDRCSQIAASLTFTTLLSLVPLIAIALTLFSAFPVFDDFSAEIKRFILSNVMPETGGKMIARYMTQFAESAANLTAVGVVFLALTAMLMMHTIDSAFNTIWRVSRPRTMVQRVLVYWAALTLAPLLIGGSLSLTSWLAGVSAGHARQISAAGVIVLKVAPVVLTTIAFSLLFRVVPNRHVPLPHAFVGGVVASAAFESMNRAFAFYIAHFPTYKLVYGAFASIPIFLLWIYLSWLTILMGALIAASLSNWRGSAIGNASPAMRLYCALRVLKQMSDGLSDGTVQTVPALSARLNIGYDTLEDVFEKLAQAGVVRKLSGHGWAMIRDAEHLKLADLYRCFVLDTATLPAAWLVEDEKICAWIERTEQRIADDAAVTLRDLYAGIARDA